MQAAAGDQGDVPGASAYDTYQHRERAKQRSDVGIQDQFSRERAPRSYWYDSSLAPELCWDESAERDYAEWLYVLVDDPPALTPKLDQLAS